jgi:hypothetical protein
MQKRLGTVHTFTMSGSSQATAAFGSQTYRVRVATGAQPAYITFGTTPTAAATDSLLGTNVIDYFDVTPGQKAAVLQAGTAGTITVTELS